MENKFVLVPEKEFRAPNGQSIVVWCNGYHEQYLKTAHLYKALGFLKRFRNNSVFAKFIRRNNLHTYIQKDCLGNYPYVLDIRSAYAVLKMFAKCVNTPHVHINTLNLIESFEREGLVEKHCVSIKNNVDSMANSNNCASSAFNWIFISQEITEWEEQCRKFGIPLVIMPAIDTATEDDTDE